jgi:flagellar motor switch protein FliN/FliY
VIALDQDAGAPMDILVNGTLIAHGEIVVIDDRFGVRLTDVVTPTERIENLN